MNSFFRFTLIFLVVYFGITLLFPASKDPNAPKNDIDITVPASDVTIGNLVQITVKNNTNASISLGKGNPPENLILERYENGSWKRLTKIDETSAETILEANASKTFSFPEKNTEYFGTEGKYKAIFQQGEKQFFVDFSVSPPGVFKTLWRVLFWKPIYNALIFLIGISNHSLGISVILLTILVKLILLVPTQKAMKSQRKMQKLQPELTEIRTKYKNDQQKIAAESMALWKKHGVNPFSSILPILMQFPVLIALYYAVLNGLSSYNSYFLYAPLKDFDFHSIYSNFLGVMPLNLMPTQDYSLLWLPIVIALLQYVAMKLSFARAAKQKKNDPKKEDLGKNFDFASEMEKMNKVFIYLFPAMIGFFTAVTPAAVGLYWGISTIFAIGQQYFVNKEVS